MSSSRVIEVRTRPETLYDFVMKSAILVAALLILAISGGSAEAQTPAEQTLFEAVDAGSLSEVKRIVAQGIAVDVTDGEKRTPMMYAAFNGHRQLVSFFLVEGAKVDHKDSNGRTALMYASSGPFVETVEVLLDAGAEVNNQGMLEGFTALMTAAAEGQLEVVTLLLERGADPTLKDVDGDTALSFARQGGHAVVVELLEQYTVDSN